MKTKEGHRAVMEVAENLWHEEQVRLQLLQLIAEEAKANGCTLAWIVEGIGANKLGPIFRRRFDEFMIGVGLPRERVLAIANALLEDKEVTPREIQALAMFYGPDLPTSAQADELRRFAHRLWQRSKRHEKAVENAKEMIKASLG